MRIKNWLKTRLFTQRNLEVVRDYGLTLAGTAVMVFAMHFFFIPSQLAVGGLSGAAQIINSYTGWPIGVMIFIFNIPLFLVGWRHLGGKRFLARTIFASAVFSALLDGLNIIFPTSGITDDLLLNAIYGGILGGIGGGLVFRARATTGGTDILARYLDKKFGIPISQGYLYTDSLVVFVAALAFSWEHALYAIIGLYVWSVVAEVSMTGLNVDRVATIITEQPEIISQQIFAQMERGVTSWQGKGMYTGRSRHMLLCATSRGEISMLKALVYEIDPQAFVVISQAHEVLGEGFRKLADE